MEVPELNSTDNTWAQQGNPQEWKLGFLIVINTKVPIIQLNFLFICLNIITSLQLPVIQEQNVRVIFLTSQCDQFCTCMNIKNYMAVAVDKLYYLLVACNSIKKCQ